jgi:hypothetical protein
MAAKSHRYQTGFVNRLGGRENDLPVSLAGTCDLFGSDRSGPDVAPLDLAIPGMAIIAQDVPVISHSLGLGRASLYSIRP